MRVQAEPVSAVLRVHLYDLYISVHFPFIDSRLTLPPINKPLFGLCLTISARPNSEQTSRAYRLFLPVNPESLIKHANSNMLFFTLTPVLHSFHAPSHLPLYN